MTASQPITLRPASEADLPVLLELIGQPDMDDGEVLALDDARALFARIASYPNYRIYMAERAGEIVGSYALLIMDNLGHLGAPSAIVEQVLVAPHAQGSGVGREMMHHAAAESRRAGCYKLVLSSNLKRERAHAFYDQLGFERHGYSFRLDIAPVETNERDGAS